MLYILSFLLFAALMVLLGAIFLASYGVCLRRGRPFASLANIFLFSSLGLLAILLTAFLANMLVGLQVFFSWPFYAGLVGLGVVSLWYIRPKISKSFLVSGVLSLFLLGFISSVEIEDNFLTAFGGNGDYHNHEKMAQMVEALPTEGQAASPVNLHFNHIKERVGGTYRYPLGAHYLLIFARNFIDLFISQPQYVSLHKYFFVYTFFLTLLLVQRFLPNRRWSWLAVAIAFSYPLLHVMVGMDFISQELSLWLAVLLIFLPSFDSKFKALPAIMFALGLVYYYSLVIFLPYLIGYSWVLFKRKAWTVLGAMVIVSGFLGWYYWPNLTEVNNEYTWVVTQKPSFPNITSWQVIGSSPYKMNPAYPEVERWSPVAPDWKTNLVLFFIATLGGSLLLKIAQSPDKRKFLPLLSQVFFQVLLVVFLLQFDWHYITFKFVSLSSLALLPTLIEVLDQKYFILKGITRIGAVCLVVVFGITAWPENRNWLLRSNGSLFFSPTFQEVLGNLDQTVVIHRNVHFMSMLSNQSFNKHLYTAALYSQNYHEVLPEGTDYHQICNLHLINRDLVKTVYIEEGACLNGVYTEEWELFNAHNDPLTKYILAELPPPTPHATADMATEQLNEETSSTNSASLTSPQTP